MTRTTGRTTARRAAILMTTGLLAAAAVGLVVVTQQGQSVPDRAPTIIPAAESVSDGPGQVEQAPPAPLAEFVPTTGGKGGTFETATIPEGWSVQANDRTALVLAPPGADADPELYLGKIVAMVGRGYPERAAAGTGKVMGRSTDGTAAVEIDRPGGDHLVVQFPPTTGGTWTDEQLLAFARGITVGAAQPIGG